MRGESRERFQEGVEIMTRAGTQETFSYAGKFHTFPNVMVLPRPVQPPMPPFPAAVAVSPAIQHAGYHSFVDETPERARRAWEPHYMRYLRFVASVLAPSVELDSAPCASWQGRAEDLRRVTFADIYPDQALCGDPALCIDRIARRREELGITHFYACMDLGGLDQRALRGSMEQFAARVMPLFRRPGSGRDPVFGPHPG